MGGGASPGNNGGNFSPEFHFGNCTLARAGEYEQYSGCWAAAIDGTGDYHCLCR
jgi:hypothetical protein